MLWAFIFYIEYWDLKFKVDSEQQIFEKLFKTNFYFNAQSFCQKSDERKSPKIYIIGHYNPSVRISDLASHHTYVVCNNFVHEWRHLQFKVDSERQIFKFLPEIFWKEVAEEIHNWSLQSFGQDYWPSFSHHLRCVR